MLVLSHFCALWLSATAILTKADDSLDFSPIPTRTVHDSWQTLASSQPTESIPLRNKTVPSTPGLSRDGVELAKPWALNERSTPAQRDTTARRSPGEDTTDTFLESEFCSRSCAGCIDDGGRQGRSLSRRVGGEIGKLSPADFHGDTKAFILELAGRAVEVPHTFSASAVHHELKVAQYAMAISRFKGCTSVVVISETGIFMSHFWEVPFFFRLEKVGDGDKVRALPSLDAVFQAEVIDRLKNGGPT